MYKSPLSQFDVISVMTMIMKNYEVSITNMSITALNILIMMYMLFYIFFKGNMMPKMWQLFLEKIFIFIYSLIYQQLGKKGLIYFPFMFSLFTFMLILNLFSLLPYGFAMTSHFVWTMYFSLSMCLGIFFMGLMNYKLKFLKLFVPNVPLFLYILMIPMELLSYILSSFSLAISLSANMIAGHMLVHIMVDFIMMLSKLKMLMMILPFFLLIGILILEMGVACMQAYIFVTLICIYMNDSMNLMLH